MTDQIPSLDLRLTPDWLKESEPVNRYADYEGDDSQDRQHRGRRDRREERPRRSSPPTDRRRQEHADRKEAPSGRTARPQQRPFENRPLPPKSEHLRMPRHEEKPARPEVEAAPVQIDFLPEERAF